MSKITSFFKTKGSSFKNWVVDKSRPIFNDYKEAASDCVTEGKNRPIKTIIYCLLAGGGVYAYKTAPSEQHFQGSLNEASNDLITISESLVNKQADSHVQNLYKLQAQDMLRYQWLGLFSVVYDSDYSAHNRNFISQCKYSNPRWNEKHKRIVDVGFCDKWWVLDYKMTDYDLNFDLEFSSVMQEYLYLFKRAVFGTGYFTELVSQPQVLSYFVDCEEIAADVELKD